MRVFDCTAAKMDFYSVFKKSSTTVRAFYHCLGRKRFVYKVVVVVDVS